MREAGWRERTRGRKVGLALAAGAARGWAHLGVITALEEAGLAPDLVAGTSIGAFVGGCYASGRLEELTALVKEMDARRVRSFLDMVFPRSGLIDGGRLMDLMRSRLFLPRFEDLPVPFRSVATDLGRGVEVVSGSGDLAEAVRASISIPGIFTPVVRGGTLMVDGSLVNPLPVSVARAMGAEFVVAVDLTRGAPPGGDREDAREASLPPPAGTGKDDGWLRLAVERGRDLFRARHQVEYRKVRRGAPPPNIFEVVLSSFQVMEAQVVRTRLAIDPPDLLVRPRVGHVGLLEFHRHAETVAEGYRAAREALA
jgi:NTE family protein